MRNDSSLAPGISVFHLVNQSKALEVSEQWQLDEDARKRVRALIAREAEVESDIQTASQDFAQTSR